MRLLHVSKYIALDVIVQSNQKTLELLAQKDQCKESILTTPLQRNTRERISAIKEEKEKKD
jgi:hypothetical protein